MKSFLILAIFLVWSPLVAVSAPHQVIELEDMSEEFKTLCETPQWQNIQLRWNGVQDQRVQKVVGEISSKKETIQIKTQSDLSANFASKVPELLKKCGIRFVKSDSPQVYKLTVLIKKFSASMDKELIKSKMAAESRIVLNFEKPDASIDVHISYLMDQKSHRFKSKKQVSKLLSKLFVGTVREMVLNNQMSFLSR